MKGLTGSSRLRVYGPPGTGKTTWLKNEVERLLRFGVPGEEIAVCSFSRAAFREFASSSPGRCLRTTSGPSTAWPTGPSVGLLWP